MSKEATTNDQTESTRNADEFVISDYEYFQKCFELWANHFMGIFYMWTGLVVVPITAGGLYADFGLQGEIGKRLFSITCIVVAVIGIFVSIKMFDIRKAQLNCADQLNVIRISAYIALGINGRYALIPFGAERDGTPKNLSMTARSDFGISMALVMSAVHGALAFWGLYAWPRGAAPQGCALAIIILVCLAVAGLNFFAYFWFVVWAVRGGCRW